MNISNRHKIISLKNKSELKEVFDRGKKISTSYGPIFKYNEKEDKEFVKVAILLKKRIGHAAKRNYIKRIIRYFLTKNHNKLENSNRLIFIYNSLKPVSYSLLEKEYLYALKK